jgi:prepilin-type N-terminal cleavage/methylation domain-containing protein
MKRSERGFTLIEVLVVIAIVAIISAAATMSTFQVFNVTRRSNDHMVTIRQVQNAGYWISRDALMAENIVVDNQTPSNFLVLTWTEWSYEPGGVSTYHEVTYSIEVLPDEIPKIWREHSTYDADQEPIESEQTLIAEYIYYDSEDPENHTDTEATYEPPDEAPDQAPVLTVQITSSLGEASETREYRVLPRPDF